MYLSYPIDLCLVKKKKKEFIHSTMYAKGLSLRQIEKEHFRL